MPTVRRIGTAPLLAAAAIVLASAPASATIPVPYGSTELGKIVSGCFSVCFGTNCTGSGTIDHLKVAPPFHVRGARLAQYGSGSVCDPDNSLTLANLEPPQQVGAGRALVFDIDLVPTMAGSLDRIVQINHEDVFELSATVTPVSFCVPSSTALCLESNRFKTRVQWRSFDGERGSGTVIPLPLDDSGLFYFFQPDNIEMVLKVLDGCGTNDRFWVFGAATTNVEYTITVTDTESQRVKTYFNPLTNGAPAITDTDAFATCP